MEFVTLFLLELVGALLLGHAALAVYKPAGGRGKAFAGLAGASRVSRGLAADPLAVDPPVIQPHYKTIGTNGHKLEEKLRDMASLQRALAEKVSMAHQRLSDVERGLVLREARAEDAVNRKLTKLENFRANTEVELLALKEILDEMSKSAAASDTGKYRKKIEAVDKNLKDLEKDLHKIIYNRSKPESS
ncbi:MAG: hypothetical protein J4203_08125 [Candidatus Diapherotrites archaeon]|uniref:Uncharacterized protein n=1 Tax=Candidatus Iainarchaeum sp. TaxID=3101447 RepID=A0A8T4LDS2_9ARCH|nr:hypothetical protein [Candidatus Diapherotrites archaeon]